MGEKIATPVFIGASVLEICIKHSEAIPESPSLRLGRPVSADLESLLLRCLAKSPSDRPCDAVELLRALERCVVTGHWSADDAAAWWASHGAGVRGAGLSASVTIPPERTQRPSPLDSTKTHQGDQPAV